MAEGHELVAQPLGEDIVIAVIDGHRSLSADERADLHRQFSRYCLSVLRLERAAGSGSVRP